MSRPAESTVFLRRLAALLPMTFGVVALVATERPVEHSRTVGIELGEIPPPVDAVVLFDGNSTEAWSRAGQPDSPAEWAIDQGDLVIRPGTGSLDSKRRFRDFQLHLQFMLPDQGNSNSGVYLLGRYEIQIINSYGRPPDKGGCGSIYQLHAPPQNASLEPGAWQTFDILFRAPRLDGDGKQLEPARISVVHNGVWLHDDVAVETGTGAAREKPLVAEGPIQLQDHGGQVRFRNLWARPLGEEAG